MPDWEITETTLHCEAVGANVTLIVHKDRAAQCTGYKKFFKNPTDRAAKEIKARERILGKALGCEGLECSRLTNYKRQLALEDEREPSLTDAKRIDQKTTFDNRP